MKHVSVCKGGTHEFRGPATHHCCASFGVHVTSQPCALKAFKNTFLEAHLLFVPSSCSSSTSVYSMNTLAVRTCCFIFHMGGAGTGGVRPLLRTQPGVATGHVLHGNHSQWMPLIAPPDETDGPLQHTSARCHPSDILGVR